MPCYQCDPGDSGRQPRRNAQETAGHGPGAWETDVGNNRSSFPHLKTGLFHGALRFYVVLQVLGIELTALNMLGNL